MPNAKIQMSNECQNPKPKSTITCSLLSFDIFSLSQPSFLSLPQCYNTPLLQHSNLQKEVLSWKTTLDS